MIAPLGLTTPHDGVIATRPAMAPEAAPSIVGLPRKIHSPNDQATAAIAVQTYVFRNTRPAKLLASRPEPTLKPNQPAHSSAAPVMTYGMLCGGMATVPNPVRLPTINAPTRPA